MDSHIISNGRYGVQISDGKVVSSGLVKPGSSEKHISLNSNGDSYRSSDKGTYVNNEGHLRYLMHPQAHDRIADVEGKFPDKKVMFKYWNKDKQGNIADLKFKPSKAGSLGDAGNVDEVYPEIKNKNVTIHIFVLGDVVGSKKFEYSNKYVDERCDYVPLHYPDSVTRKRPDHDKLNMISCINRMILHAAMDDADKIAIVGDNLSIPPILIDKYEKQIPGSKNAFYYDIDKVPKDAFAVGVSVPRRYIAKNARGSKDAIKNSVQHQRRVAGLVRGGQFHGYIDKPTLSLEKSLRSKYSDGQESVAKPSNNKIVPDGVTGTEIV